MNPKELELMEGRQYLDFFFWGQIPLCGSTSLATVCKTLAGLARSLWCEIGMRIDEFGLDFLARVLKPF